ncbi:MAG: hypothetical protein Q7S05_04485 [bacterium]|nr:hypothetical protein [bacterium]
MKKIEKDKARHLRAEGYSMNEIVRLLNVSKSSVSLWVRDVKLTVRQRKRLSENGHTLEVIEKRRTMRLYNEFTSRQVTFRAATDAISRISDRDLFFLGLALYAGEGAKYSRGNVCFYNSDPRLVQVMVKYFKRVCGVKDKKFKGHVLLHPHLDARKAEQYWSKISGIPLSQFQKTSQQHNKASKGKKDSLPMGTFMIGVYDTVLFLKIMGWMDGTYRRVVSKKSRVPDKYASVL